MLKIAARKSRATLLSLSMIVAAAACTLSLTPLAYSTRPIASRSASRALPPAALQSQIIIINEYLADPPDGAAGDANGDGARSASQDEFIELVNVSGAALSLDGFVIRDSAGVIFAFPAGRVMPPGEAALIFGGGAPQGAFGNARANNLVFTAGGAGLSLNNGGDSIVVRDASGAELARRDFLSPDGNANQSITRSPDVTGGFVAHASAAGSEGALFSPGTLINGRPFVSPDPVISSISPGSIIASSVAISLTIDGRNFKSESRARVDGMPITTTFIDQAQLSAIIPPETSLAAGAHAITVENPDGLVSNAVSFVVISRIGVNEYLADPPDGPAGDANGDGARDSSQDEFVEIVNRGDAAINVGGYSVGDADQTRFTFPPGTIIPAGEAAVVFGGGRAQGEFGNAASNGLVFAAGLSLNNGGDTIRLKDAAGNLVESISYGPSEGSANQSINRNPDVSGASFALHSSIIESGGRLFSPGSRVSGAPFTASPRIARIDPDRVPLGNSPFTVSIIGSGFDAGAVALIDHSPVPTEFLSDGHLRVTAPERVAAVAGDHSIEVHNGNGNRSNAATLTVIPPGPLLRSLRPVFVPADSGPVTILLQGANFLPSSIALVEDAPLDTVFINARELGASVPASVVAAVGSRRVRVRNGDGQASNELSFEVIAPIARILTIAPAQAIAQGAGFSMVVTGLNFSRDSTVFFDETALTTRFTSASELRAEVPEALIERPGLRAVTVRSAGAAASNEAIFRVVAIAPIVRSIEPDSVIEGAGDVTISLAGENFERGAVVRVMDELRPGLALDTAFIDEGRLAASLPSELTEAAGRLLLRVENPNFGISDTVALSVLIKDPLVVNEYLADPADGAAGDANGDGARSSSQDEFIEIVNRTGDAIDISGYKLSDGEAVRHVFSQGVAVPPFESVVVFGGGTPRGAFGNAAENRMVFKASSGGLSLNNGGDTIKLEDAAGRIVQEIRFGPAEGNAGQSLNRAPDVSGPVFSLHSQAEGANFRLFSPGSKPSGAPFTVKPVINSIAPAHARKGSAATRLLVSGANFVPGALVLFDETPLETIYCSSVELEARLSERLLGEGGAAAVRVRNARGEMSEARKFVILDEAPRLVSLSPQQAATGAEAFEIAVLGERFQRGAMLLIGEEAVAAKFIDGALMVAVVPEGFFARAASFDVRVLNADGNRSNAATFRVENGPLITRLSRSRIKAGSGAVRLTVGGLAFKPGAVLFINDRPVQTVREGDTALSATIEAELTVGPGLLTLQARNPDGGRSNRAIIRVVE